MRLNPKQSILWCYWWLQWIEWVCPWYVGREVLITGDSYWLEVANWMGTRYKGTCGWMRWQTPEKWHLKGSFLNCTDETSLFHSRNPSYPATLECKEEYCAFVPLRKAFDCFSMLVRWLSRKKSTWQSDPALNIWLDDLCSKFKPNIIQGSFFIFSMPEFYQKATNIILFIFNIALLHYLLQFTQALFRYSP